MNHALKLFRSVALILLLGMLAVPQMSRAQASLGISGLSGIPDTLQEGDSAMVSFYVKNYSGSVFTGNFVLNAYLRHHDVHALTPIDSIPCTNFFIGPWDSILVMVPFRVNTPNTSPQGPLRIGNNIIVVWPRSLSTGVSTADSLVDSVFVVAPTSIAPHSSRDNSVYFYFNAQAQDLFIMPGPDEVYVESVLVRDLLGRTLYTFEGHPRSIDVSFWKNGLYLIEVNFGKGERRTYKVLKQ